MMVRENLNDRSSIWAQGFYQFVGAFGFGLDTAILCISYAVLLYQNSLAHYYSFGLNLLLLGAIFTVFVTSLFSSLPTAVAQPQDETFPVYVLMAVGIMGAFATAPQSISIFPTVLTAIAIATISTGIIFLIFGVFGIGNFMAFIPYPVVGGFLAGVGWLLLSGAFSMLTGVSLNYNHLTEIIEPLVLIKWLIALLYGLIMMFLVRKKYNSFLVVCLITLSIVLFYTITYSFNIPLSDLQSQGFLISGNVSTNFSQQLKNVAFNAVNWQVLWDQSGKIAAIIVLGVVCAFIKSMNIELTLHKKININHELKVAGLANVLTGLVGGVIGYLTIGHTTADNKFHKNKPIVNRLINISTISISLLGLTFITHYSIYLPRFIPGGIFTYFALNLLREWLVKSYKKIFLRDYLVIIAILLTIMAFGILPGVILGITLSMVFFIINYSRISVVKYVLTGRDLHSSKQRESYVQKWLFIQGESLVFIKLQNYLFFGNVKRLSEELENRLVTHPLTQYVIYDFSAIDGLDSSSVLSFTKMGELAIKAKFYLIFSGMSSEVHQFLEANKIFEGNPYLLVFSNYDTALEWCEEKQIKENHLLIHEHVSLEEKMKEIQGDKAILSDLSEYYEEVQLKKGEYLFKANDPIGPLYYIESGYLAVILDEGCDKERRVRSIGPGNTVGEVAFYLQHPRTATIVADEDCVLYKFTLDDIMRMNENPDLALKFQQFIVTILAERIAYANQQLSVLL